jgi:hypothetical protein
VYFTFVEVLFLVLSQATLEFLEPFPYLVHLPLFFFLFVSRDMSVVIYHRSYFEIVTPFAYVTTEPQ